VLASLALLNDFVTLPLAKDASPSLAKLCPGASADVQLIEEILTRQGFEVESRSVRGSGFETVVVGRITDAKPHPQADRLQVCQVDAGGGIVRQIVCGAPNARSGLFVAVALPGTTLPNGTVIKGTEIRGVSSHGMLCSRSELALPVLTVDGDGIWELDRLESCGKPGRELEPLIGEPVFNALGLSDVVLDLSVTPNRPDGLCHLGIARELYTGFRHAGLKQPWIGTAWLKSKADASRSTPSEDAAHPSPQALLDAAVAARSTTSKDHSLTFEKGSRFVCQNNLGIHAFFVAFEGLFARPSPGWLRRRLEAIGQNSVNDVVDLSNLLLHCLGQPSHAFDFDKMAGEAQGARLILRKAAAGEPFVGLDGKERQLHPEDRVVACEPMAPGTLATNAASGGRAEAPQGRAEALLGLLGGEGTKVTEGTQRVVVEWANPDAVAVRRTSRRVGRKTDSGFQFEKGLDRSGRLHAAHVFAQLLFALQPSARWSGLCGWPDIHEALLEGFDVAPDKPSSWSNESMTAMNAFAAAHGALCLWHDSSLEKFLGQGATQRTLAPWALQLKILANLGFRFLPSQAVRDPAYNNLAQELSRSEAEALKTVAVLVPHWRRPDVDGEADLAEEIARVVGIDNVPGEPMTLSLDSAPDDGHLAFFEESSRAMAHLGYTEITSFHFMRDDDWRRLGLANPNALGPAIRMANPIVMDEPLLQTTLIPDLLRKVAFNINHGTASGQMFHVSRTFQNWDARGHVVFAEEAASRAIESQAALGTCYDPAMRLSFSAEDHEALRPSETPRLAFAVFGHKEARTWSNATPKNWTLHDVIGHVRDLAWELGCSLVFEPMHPSYPWHTAVHPGQCSTLVVTASDGSKHNCGWLATVHPRTLRAFGIESPVIACELNMATLYRARRVGRDRNIPLFRPNRFPAVKRDFAVVVNSGTTAHRLEEVVRNTCSDASLPCRLASFGVFDVYQGDKVPQGQISIGFEVVLEPHHASLTDEQIQSLSQAIIKGLESELGAVLRC
jgi:phenylalanyl-tRNA synthetase beta chain